MENKSVEELLKEQFPHYDDEDIEEAHEAVMMYVGLVRRKMASADTLPDLPTSRKREDRYSQNRELYPCSICKLTPLNGSKHHHFQRRKK